MNDESRLAVVETKLSEHERRLETVEDTIGGVRDSVSSIDTNVKVLMSQFQDYKKNQEKKSNKDRWMIGLIVAAASVVVDLALVAFRVVV